MILEGPQGIGKSTAAKILAGDAWFTDYLPDVGNKDAAMQLPGDVDLRDR
jgi:putative DNA primase/helicase